MSIMDVLESLGGPEYDEPDILDQDAPEEKELEVIGEVVTEEEPAEEPESEEEIPEAWPDEMQLPEGPAPKRKIRAEWIMLIVAALAGTLLGIMVLVYFIAK